MSTGSTWSARVRTLAPAFPASFPRHASSIRWFPMQQPSPDAHASNWAADMAACRSHLREGSRTFYAASFLLPRHVREPASALYAFCRLADDAVDLRGGSFAAIDALRCRLDRAYGGHPVDSAIDRAFARTVASS